MLQRVASIIARHFGLRSVGEDLDIGSQLGATREDRSEIHQDLQREFGTQLNSDFSACCRTARDFHTLVINALY